MEHGPSRVGQQWIRTVVFLSRGRDSPTLPKPWKQKQPTCVSQALLTPAVSPFFPFILLSWGYVKETTWCWPITLGAALLNLCMMLRSCKPAGISCSCAVEVWSSVLMQQSGERDRSSKTQSTQCKWADLLKPALQLGEQGKASTYSEF